MRNLENLPCFLVTLVLSMVLFLKVVESKPTSSYQDTKVCTGSNTGLHHTNAGRPFERYKSYVERYGNCTTIQESVEIVFLDGEHDNYDMSFLESIRVVNGYVLIYGNLFETLPLKNLRLIRGRSLYTQAYLNKSYSLYISTNYKAGSTDKGLKEVHLTSLHEILNGEILFERNNLLCHAQSINWVDILSSRTTPTFKQFPEGQFRRQCEECHANCTFNNNTGHCWGPTADQCQRITSFVCASNCEHRCFGPEPTQCCDPQCAGGCGRDKHDCWVCRHYTNYGECVDKCPGKKIYNIKTYRYEDNPDARYIYGTNCVRECPAHMLIENEVCVSKCSEGFFSGADRNCKKCDDEVCPKTCTSRYEYISNENVASFNGCTIVEGHLVFAKNSFEPQFPDSIKDMSVLDAFENVREISDYIIVQGNHVNFTSLSFLRNLRIVSGRILRAGRISVAITGTSLEELGLSSLRKISNGDVIIAGNSRLQNLGFVSLEEVSQGSVTITRNSQLCYANSINWTEIVKGSGKTFRLQDNANLTNYCEPNGFVCSNQCSDGDGCWGETDNDCRYCAYHRFGQTCVSSCEFQKGLYPKIINGTSECRRCHEQCHDDCTGGESDKCLACKNVKDGSYCLENCPPMKFVSAMGTCELCYEHCKGGCSGNGSYLGTGGCRDSHLMINFENGTNISFPEDSVCPSNFYNFRTRHFVNAKNKFVSVAACRPCNPECHTCLSSGTSQRRDRCECINVVHDDHCVTECPHAHYKDAKRQCFKCHHECLECYGPTAAECSLCKNSVLFDEESPPENDEYVLSTTDGHTNISTATVVHLGTDQQKGTFNCTDTCPDLVSERTKTRVGNHLQFVCTEKQLQTESSENKGTTIVLPVVICVVAIGVVAIVAVFMNRQCEKSEENKLGIAALMNGLGVEEE